MRSGNNFSVSARKETITSVEAKGSDDRRFEAEGKAVINVIHGDGGKISLSIAGIGLWAKLNLNKRAKEQLVKDLEGKKKAEAGVKTYFYPRKTKEGAMS